MKVPGGGPEALTYLVPECPTEANRVLPYLCVPKSPRGGESGREEGGVTGGMTCWKFSSIGTVLAWPYLARPVFVVTSRWTYSLEQRMKGTGSFLFDLLTDLKNWRQIKTKQNKQPFI